MDLISTYDKLLANADLDILFWNTMFLARTRTLFKGFVFAQVVNLMDICLEMRNDIDNSELWA